MIRVGLIGCGHWGPNYIRAFQKIKGVFLDIACDLDKKKLETIRIKYPHIKVTNNDKEVINNSLLDAIVVATPAKTHYPLVKRGLEAGKHILVEKPLTDDVNEARKLVKLSQKCERVLMPGHIFEHHDGIKSMKKYVSGNKLGKIYYMYSRRTNLGPIRYDVNAIWDLALHDISIFNFILDSVPIKVAANGFSYLRRDIEDIGFVTLYYPKGIVAHLHVSWLDPRKIREIVMVGNKKMLMFNDLDYTCPIKIYDKRVMKKKYERPYNNFEEFKMIIKDGQMSTPDLKIREPLVVECESFIDSVRLNKFDVLGLKRGADAVKVLAATKESLGKSGSEVKVRG